MAKKERKVIGPVQLTSMAYMGGCGAHDGYGGVRLPGGAGDVVNVDVTITKKSLREAASSTSLSHRHFAPRRPAPFSALRRLPVAARPLPGAVELQQLVADAERIGHLPTEVQPTLGMAEPWHYRNTMEFGFTFGAEPGLRRLRGHRIVPIKECLISREGINETRELLWECFVDARMADVIPHNAFVRVGEHTPAAVVGLFGHGDWPDIADRMARERPELISGVVRGSVLGRTYSARIIASTGCWARITVPASHPSFR